jgi:hypothetical protein
MFLNFKPKKNQSNQLKYLWFESFSSRPGAPRPMTGSEFANEIMCLTLFAHRTMLWSSNPHTICQIITQASLVKKKMPVKSEKRNNDKKIGIFHIRAFELCLLPARGFGHAL